jgi:hypothetical protein
MLHMSGLDPDPHRSTVRLLVTITLKATNNYNF